MERSICGFHQDEEGHWVAELSCGHNQHMRHDPPLVERPWVLDESSRAARIGAPIDCPLCERRELPERAQPYDRTPTLHGAPEALAGTHRTPPGVWSRIEVIGGRLVCHLGAPGAGSIALGPGEAGIVPPEIPHRLAPSSDAAFFVELLRVER